jgi:hypothetical protein
MSSPPDRKALRQDADRSITIEVTTNTSQLALLEGLEIWRGLGLLAQTQIRLTLTTKTSHPELLAGLEELLRLGLIGERQVQQLCLKLVCPLPQPTVIRTASTTSAQESSQPLIRRRLPELDTDFAPDEPAAPARRQPSQQPSWIEQRWQSLQAELSLRWLLFLGVFMVVVSSGVLAASQWQNFPAAGQYGVLFGYTLCFWGISYWATQQSNLRLTAQTLQIVTLLLVPVNFWAMDGFRLWRHPLDWIVVAFATAVLSAITVFLWKRKQQSPLPIINYLGLSYLHWGWGVLGFPLIAVYLGIGGTIAAFYSGCRKRNSSLLNNWAAFLIVIYGIGVLLFRGIFVTGIEFKQLGLAIGACGWFLCWMQQRISTHKLQTPESEAQSSPLTPLGGGLLFLGWLVSVGEAVPWQAIAVSGLGLWLLYSRLQRFWHRTDLAAIFGIGLQTIWLLWRLIPSNIQTQLVVSATQLTDSQDTPYALLSLILFPYLILFVGLTDWLYRQQQRHLAEFGDAIALCFATILTVISSVNPLLRTLNLLNSTITLAIITKRRESLALTHNRKLLIYLTHITGITTILCAIEYWLPNLNLGIWAAILLILMVAEWGFSINNEQSRVAPTANPQSPLPIPHSPIWRDSAWHIGLGLAGLSYTLLYLNSSASFVNPVANPKEWGLLWLIVPLSLTGVAARTPHSKRKLASTLSVVALAMAQLLTLLIPGARLIGLGVATSLMLVNTRYLRRHDAAVITIGFGLTFLGMVLWEGIPGLPPLSLSGWLVAGAIALTSLWLCRSWALRRAVGTRQVLPLLQIYAKAADDWAIALCSVELILLTLHSLSVYWRFISPAVPVLIAGVITMGAIAYRSLPQPSSWAIYAMGWSLELLTAEGLGFLSEASVINLAVANLALGLIAQLVGDWWRRRKGLRNVPISWHVIPLLYGILGAVLRWGTFTSWTGLFSLALALIFIGVGRRREEFKPLVYLAVFGVSVSAYELLFYQLSQASGGGTGDGLIAMATLGTGIMYAYRVLSPWLTQYLHLTRDELKVIAHLHWAWSSCLLIAATANPIVSGMMVGFGTGAFLVQYAIFQGRNHPSNGEGANNPSQTSPYQGGARGGGEIWVYLGFLEAFGMRLYWLSTPVAHLLGGPLVPWKSAIAAMFAYFLYFLPWENWGWSKRPWQLAAIIVPLIAIGETPNASHPVSVLIVAGFYIFLAIVNQQIQFTYISAVLIDWIFLRWFWHLQLGELLWYVIPLGLSLLYIAQVDPYLKQAEQKEARHFLRLLGSGVICLVALWSNQWSGLVTGAIAVLVIFAGLGLRVRAFLFVGTATFLVNAFYQLGILIFDYPISKWVIGLLAGIAFIWIAATFETRREQITVLLRNWMSELQNWD